MFGKSVFSIHHNFYVLFLWSSTLWSRSMKGLAAFTKRKRPTWIQMNARNKTWKLGNRSRIRQPGPRVDPARFIHFNETNWLFLTVAFSNANRRGHIIRRRQGKLAYFFEMRMQMFSGYVLVLINSKLWTQCRPFLDSKSQLAIKRVICQRNWCN